MLSQSLRTAILELHRQPRLREQWGGAARLTVATHYSQETMLRRLEALYLELMEGKKRG